MKLQKIPVAGFLLILIFTCLSSSAFAQPVMETGGQKMPDERIVVKVKTIIASFHPGQTNDLMPG